MESKPIEIIKKPDEKSLKHAVHGLFAKVQQKTGLEDKKIDEFQQKWLAIPENRTKYQKLADAPTIMGEELFAMFNDIIDFVQAQEVGQSHIFSSLRKESEEILKNPEDYFHHVVSLGKGWMDRGMGWAKSWMNHGSAPAATAVPTKNEDLSIEKNEIEPPEEELSDFEKAELEDQKTEKKPSKKRIQTSKPEKARKIRSKPVKSMKKAG